MHKNCNTIPELFSLLKNHIDKTTEFNGQLDIWLSNSVASDLYFKAVTDSLVRKELGLSEHITISHKIIATVKEIENNSKLYLANMLQLFQVFEVLIRFTASV